MVDYANKLLTELEDQLKFIDLEQDDPLKSSQLSIDVCLKAVGKLKSIILKHKFKSQGEEIKFFKAVKPKFLSPLIYHLKIFKIESRKPND